MLYTVGTAVDETKMYARKNRVQMKVNQAMPNPAKVTSKTEAANAVKARTMIAKIAWNIRMIAIHKGMGGMWPTLVRPRISWILSVSRAILTDLSILGNYIDLLTEAEIEEQELQIYGEKKVRSEDKQKPMLGCQALMHLKLAQFQRFGP